MSRINDAIEARVPNFLKYTVIGDPFQPRVHFQFGDYQLAIMLDDNLELFGYHLDEVARKFERTLPENHRVIWRYLLTGETDAQVYNVNMDKKKAVDIVEFEQGIQRSHALDCFPLRDGPMWAAYVEDLNILAVGYRDA